MPKNLVRDEKEPFLYINSETGIYYFRKYDTRTQTNPEYSLRTQDRALAVRRMRRWLDDLKAVREDKRRMAVVADVHWELLSIYKTRAKATFEQYENTMRRHVLPFFAPVKLADVPKRWPEYVSIQKRINPARKLQHDRRALHRLLYHSVERDYIVGFKRLKLDSHETTPAAGRSLSIAEVRSLIQAARGWQRFFLLLLVSTGARRDDIRLLEYSNVDRKRGMIRVARMREKRRIEKEFPVPKPLLRMLAAMEASARSKYVFPNKRHLDQPISKSQKFWQRIQAETGVRCKMHWLRHTFITEARRAGESGIVIQKLLGASSRVQDRVYTHYEAEELRSFQTKYMRRFGIGSEE